MSIVKLQIKSEDYSPQVLDVIDIGIGPLKVVYNAIMGQIKDVVKGYKNFLSAYIEGLYGTGKTLVLRKTANDIVNNRFYNVSNKEYIETPEYEKIIPLYFYLGETPFLPFTYIKNMIEDIENYTEKGIVNPRIIGRREKWRKRIDAIKKCYESTSTSTRDKNEVDLFFEFTRCLNHEGYYPLVIFDEFERVIYTGEALVDDASRIQFVNFIKRYLELTRGQIYTGGFIIASTRPLRELVEKAFKEERPHIIAIADIYGIPREKLSVQFPLLSANIVYDIAEKIIWDYISLKLLAQRYNLTIHDDILYVISRVLPVPRAIIQIVEKTRAVLGEGQATVSLKDFYIIIKPKIEGEFIKKLVNEKIDNKWIIPPQAKWHLRFQKLLEHGYYVITREKFDELVDILDVKKTPRARQAVSNILQKLARIGLLVREGPGTYLLNPYILAYALGIERLPSGEEATLDNLIMNIKNRIKEIREEYASRRKTTK